MIVTVYILV